MQRRVRSGAFVGLAVITLFVGLTPRVALGQDEGLECLVDEQTVTLSWNIQFLVPIAGFRVIRDGLEIARLDPGATNYVDRDVPMLARMLEKRIRGYRAMGYVVTDHLASEPIDDYVIEYDEGALEIPDDLAF